MKNVNKLRLTLLMTIGILIYSCQDEFNENTELTEPVSEIDTSKLIDFKGLKVNHRFSTPVNELENELNFSSESIASRYNRISKAIRSAKNGVANKNSNTLLKEDDEIDYEVILEAKDRVIDLFPYKKADERDFEFPSISENLDTISLTEEEFIALENTRELDSIALVNYEKDYLERQEQQARANFEMIRQDFPTLTEAQIEKHTDLIDNYYQQNLNYVVLKNIAKNGDNLVSKKSAINRSLASKAVPTWVLKGTAALAITALYGPINLAIAYTSGDKAKKVTEDYFKNSDLDGANDRRDAFRHLIWNAYLAKNYVGILPIKAIKTTYARTVTDLHEWTGTNEPDSKEMDYHNNAIGRKIYKDNTRFMLFYLSEPSYTKIESIALDYANKKSCYLRKTIDDDDANRDYLASEIKAQILQENDNTVVYFKGPIASSWYTPRWTTIITKEYQNCDTYAERQNALDWNDPEVQQEYYESDDFDLCIYVPVPKIVKSYRRITPCSKNN